MGSTRALTCVVLDDGIFVSSIGKSRHMHLRGGVHRAWLSVSAQGCSERS